MGAHRRAVPPRPQARIIGAAAQQHAPGPQPLHQLFAAVVKQQIIRLARHHAAPQRRQPRRKARPLGGDERAQRRAVIRFLQRGLARRLRQSGNGPRLPGGAHAFQQRAAQTHTRHRIPLGEGPQEQQVFMPLQLSQQRVRGRIVQKFVEALVHHKACAAGGAPL